MTRTWLAAALLSTVLAAPHVALAQTPVEVQAVDALNAVFGKHPGMRANHAKGIVFTGSFTASPDAASISKAAHLQPGVTVPIVGRFSDATGLPDIPDNAPGANPHGMAIRFHLPDGSDTDIVANSLHFFPVANVADFRDLLLAVKATTPNSPKPTPVEQFFAAHKAAGPAFASAATPASFATETYYGIDAFMMTDKAGETHATRYRIEPLAGSAHLTPDQAAKQKPDFLIDDIRARLAHGPVQFRLLVQVADPGDPITDATQPWPDSRRTVTLGTITVSAIPADADAQAKALLFLPGQVTDGIEASADPLIDSRDTAYAESFARRSQ